MNTQSGSRTACRFGINPAVAFAASLLAAACSGIPALAAEGKWIELFNGRDLKGWRFQDPVQSSQWTVGTAALDPANDRQLIVIPGGTDLINPVASLEVISSTGRGVDIYSEETFGDARVELEVMVARRSNSGIYLMGEYEVQVLDSYGEPGIGPKDMGSIYAAASPKVNACKAPGEWQKFEIEYRAPRFDAEGRKIANARFTKVTLNGVLLHENVEVPHASNGGISVGARNARGTEIRVGPLMFQGNHGPVAYRNIRVMPLDEPASRESWSNPPKTALPAVEHHTFPSASMNLAVGYNLYLPPGYDYVNRRFPVVYYLNGRTNTESEHMELFGILDHAIRAREVPPMILVYAMCGRTSYYCDSPDRTVMGETVFKELVAHVDRTVRTIAGSNGRAVMGFSMGGQGAVKFALKYPNLFGSAVSFSGGFVMGDLIKERHPEIIEKMFANDVRRFDDQTPQALLRAKEGKIPLRLVIGRKDLDFMLESNRQMKALLQNLKFDVEYKEIDGVAHSPKAIFPLEGLEGFKFVARHFRP